MSANGGCGTTVAAAAFDALPEPVWELHGEDLLVTAANRAARAVAATDVVVPGSRFDAVGPGLDDPELLAALRHVLRTGEPVRDLRWTRPATPRTGSTRYSVDADQVHALDGSVRGVLARARETGAPHGGLRLIDGGGGGVEGGGLGVGGVGGVEVAPAAPALPAHMPDRVPVVPGARIAAHHVDASHAVRTGEWFDVVALPGQRVALAVGTVGRLDSAAAEAAAAAALRAVLADCLLAGGGVADALARLDAVAARTPTLHGSTVALAL
uniref:PAS domain-containing protein n=1 Tax=Pseudonocardia lacus TaxID=2835865 RepID=UPI001BDD4364